MISMARIAEYAWPALRLVIAAAIAVAAFWVDQRMTQAEVRRDLAEHTDRLNRLEQTDREQAAGARAEGEWRGRMVERMDALLNRLDRIERKIDGAK